MSVSRKCSVALEGDIQVRKRLLVDASLNRESFVRVIRSKFAGIEIAEIRDEFGNIIDLPSDVVDGDTLIVVPAGFSKPTNYIRFTPFPASESAVTTTFRELQVLRSCTNHNLIFNRLIRTTNRSIVFAVRISLSNLPRPSKLYALKLIIPYEDLQSHMETWHEWCVLDRIPPHPNISTCWSHYRAEVPAFAQQYLPEPVQMQLRSQNSKITQQALLEYYSEDLESYRVRSASPLPVATMLQFCKDILQAIVHLEDNNVVHCDLKMSNILVSNGARLVLSDFDHSIIFESGIPFHLEYSQGMNFGGNIEHLAPEVRSALRDKSQTTVTVDYSKQDVWAAAVIMYELVVGRHPIPDYSSWYEEDNEIKFSESKLPQLPVMYPLAFVKLLGWMIRCDSQTRVTARAALRIIEKILLGDNDIRLPDLVSYEYNPSAQSSPKPPLTNQVEFPVKSSSGMSALVQLPVGSTARDIIQRALDILNINYPFHTCALMCNQKVINDDLPVSLIDLGAESHLLVVGGLAKASPDINHFPPPAYSSALPNIGPQANPQIAAAGNIPEEQEDVAMSNSTSAPQEGVPICSASTFVPVAPQTSQTSAIDPSVIQPISPDETDEQRLVRLVPQSQIRYRMQPGGNLVNVLTGAGYVFNPVSASDQVRFSEQFTIAECDGKWSSVAVLMGPVVTGRCLFAVKLLSADSGCGFAIGMACAPRDNHGISGAQGRAGFDPKLHSLGAHPDSFAYSKTGKKGSGQGFLPYGSAMVTGDVIQVETDMDAGTIRFYRNGVDQGIAFDSGVKGETLFPVVCLGSNKGGKMTRVQLINPTPMSFDKARSHARMQCCANGKLQCVKNERKWATTLCTHNGVVSGKCSFSIRLSAVQSGGGVAVGVVDAQAFNPKSSNLGASEYSWGFSKTGKRGDGTGFKDYGGAFTNGDVVTIHLDMDKGTLAFDVNGIYQGIAYGPGSPDYNPDDTSQPRLKGRCIIPAVCLGSSEGDKSCQVELTDEDRHYRIPHFDPLRCRPTTQLSEFCRLAETRGKWGTVFVNMNPITSGYATVGFEIVSAEAGCGAAVGCADAEVFKPAISNLGASPWSWAYSKTGKASKGAAKFFPFGSPYKTGDIITVDIDMEEGSIDFYRNGRFEGTLESGNLQGRAMIPAVCIGNSDGGLHTAIRLVPPAVIRFDPGRKSSHIRLDGGGRKAVTSSKWASIFALHPGQSEGILRFAVKLWGNGGAAVGVADVNNFKPQYQNIGAAAYSWALSKSGKIACGEGWRAYTDKLDNDDIVGVEMNFNTGNLSFYRNGRNLGVAFENLEGRGYIMVPTVCIGSNMGERDSMAILFPLSPGSNVFPSNDELAALSIS